MPDHVGLGSDEDHDPSGSTHTQLHPDYGATAVGMLRSFPDRLEESRRLRVLVVGSIFAVTTILYLWQALFGFGTLVAVDMNELGDPYRSAIDRPASIANVIQTDQVEVMPYIVAFTDGLKKFEYRLWDPNVSAGVPLGSMPTFLVASPFNVAFLVAPAWYAVGLKVALQLLMGQVLMYLFLRRLRVGVLPAALGGVIYAFSGANVVLLHRMTAPFLVPGALWAAHRVVTRLRWRDVALLAMFIGWGWLEGFPSGWVYMVYLTVGWIAWLVISSLVSDLRESVGGAWLAAARRIGAGVTGILTGTFLVAFTMIPFIVEVIDRGTMEGRVFAASVAPLRPGQILGMLHDSTLGEWRGTAYRWWSGTNPVESVALFGGIAAIVVVIGYLAGSKGWLRLSSSARSAWAYLSLVAVLVTTATYFGTPVLRVFNILPGLAGNPVNRTRFVVALAVATVAAMTVDWLATTGSAFRLGTDSDADHRPVRAPRAVSVIMLGAGVVALFLALRDWIPLARSMGQLRISATSMLWMFVVSVAVVATAGVAVRRRVLAPWAILVLAGAAFIQVTVPYYGFTPTSPIDDFYTSTRGHQVIARLAGDDFRFAATGLTTFYPNGSQVVGAPDLRGAAMHSREFKNLIKTINPIAFDRDAFKIIMSRGEWDLGAPALDHLAVKYFALDTRERPYGVQRDFRVESLTSDIGGVGPYSLGTGSSEGAAFIVEADESTGEARIRFTDSSRNVVPLLYAGSTGARVAVGDLDGEPGDEVLLAPVGWGSELAVFDVEGEQVASISLASQSPPGGWWPSIGDTDGDGRNEIVLGSGAGAPPTVIVLDADGDVVSEFMAFAEGFFGGVSTGVGDVDGDGVGEIVVAAGMGGGPHVRALSQSGDLVFDFFAYDTNYTGGVAVAVGDAAAGGSDEIVVASLDGSLPLKVFNGSAPIGIVAPYVSAYYRITTGDLDGYPGDEIVVGSETPVQGTVSVAIADGDLMPVEWTRLAGTLERETTVSGPFSAMAISLKGGDGCESGAVSITVSDAAYNALGTSRRQISDLVSGWNMFAINGMWATTGDTVGVAIENASTCVVAVGTVGTGSAPAVRFFAPDPSVRLVSTEQAWIYERPDAWPLLSTHARWQGYDTQVEALADIALDPEVVRFVGPAVTATQVGPPPRIIESNITRQGAVLVTEGPATGIVVFSQNDALGWKAYIDGVLVEHVSVDGALLGVFVPPGRHKVEFVYEPWHFPVGVAVSLTTVLFLALIAVLGRARARRRRAN